MDAGAGGLLYSPANGSAYAAMESLGSSSSSSSAAASLAGPASEDWELLGLSDPRLAFGSFAGSALPPLGTPLGNYPRTNSNALNSNSIINANINNSLSQDRSYNHERQQQQQ
jgi:hypothetical protein